MKKLVLSALALLTFATASIAQSAAEGEYSMSEGNNNGIRMELPGADVKDVVDQWEDFTKKNFKAKAKKNKAKEYFCDDAEVKAFSSDNTVDIYADITGSDANSTITVWYDLGGAYLNSGAHGEDFVEAEKLMYKFALAFQKAMIEEELKDEEKNLKKMENDLEKLGKQKEGYEKDIEDYKQKIEDKISDIEQNVKDQAQSEADIATQKEIVKEVENRLRELE